MTEIAAFCFVLLALTAFVAAPLYARSSGGPGSTDEDAPDAGHWAAEQALRDLEIDRASGLLDEAEYAAERAWLESRWRTAGNSPSD